jgi:hypothetical protein
MMSQCQNYYVTHSDVTMSELLCVTHNDVTMSELLCNTQ